MSENNKTSREYKLLEIAIFFIVIKNASKNRTAVVTISRYFSYIWPRMYNWLLVASVRILNFRPPCIIMSIESLNAAQRLLYKLFELF